MKDDQTTLSVSELNQRAKSLLELHLNKIWVEGEVSNFSQPASGHWYFTLKDDNAQIRCAMFRNRNLLIKTRIKAGDQIRVQARVSLYTARGDYQLIVDHAEPAGVGALQAQFEQLKQKLLMEGLFAPEHKKALPSLVKHVAVITSPTGAALHDILTVLKRRNPAIQITVVGSAVQGEQAPQQLMRALQQAQQTAELDAIILGRGGGSIEDLWSFNNEELARDIFSCKVPIISAVGHETDFSIADFVADARAATPSAAAELVSIDRVTLLQTVRALQQRLVEIQHHQIAAHKAQVANLMARLKHPGEKIEQWQQRSDFLEQRFFDAINKVTTSKKQRLQLLQQRFEQQSPAHYLAAANEKLTLAHAGLCKQINLKRERSQHALASAARALDIVSPLATLDRGYTIAKSEKGDIIKSLEQVSKKQDLQLRFKDGHAVTTVISKHPEPNQREP